LRIIIPNYLFMNKIVNISEAASLAFHSLALIAKSKKLINANEIAKIMEFSKNHLSKVLQVLVKYGYISSVRGPKGGFVLKKKAGEISLLEVYEIFDGKIHVEKCALHNNVECPFNSCVFGDLTNQFSSDFEFFLQNKTIADVV